MRAHYAPAALAKIAEYERDLTARSKAGAISTEEAATLYTAFAAKVLAEVGDHGTLRMVECPACHRTEPVLGNVQRFRCGCSPKIERAVADCVASV